MSRTVVVSRRGADRIRAGHPWVYRSDISRADAEPGDIVRVADDRERHLGWAYWSSASQIALRMLSADPAAPEPDETGAWLRERVQAASAYRESLGIDASAWRVVHGEADRLPATIVDRYGDSSGTYFVVQTLTQGSDRRLDALVQALVALFEPRGVLARNDPKVRQLEGLEDQVAVLYGEIPERVAVREGAVTLHVDLRQGQKTGSFLDQRENHQAAGRYARGRVLDGFTYNGGFALQMATGADSVLALDSSAAAVAATAENARLNGLANVEPREVNVFDELRELESSGVTFDVIVLDPPAFARNKAAVERAAAGYKEINLRAMRLLAPGGHLVTCSCSYNVGETLFLEILREAAIDSRRTMTLVEKRMQARDHPVLITVPETHYLKCMVLRRGD
jgi:23S rRNA (cytosine1962-C5)-methyltransferase